MGQRAKDDFAAQRLHLLPYLLRLFPVRQRGPARWILFFGQRDGHGLAFDFARPLGARSPGSWPPVLHIALTDPAQPGQSAALAGVGRRDRGEFDVPAGKASTAVNRAVYLPP